MELVSEGIEIRVPLIVEPKGCNEETRLVEMLVTSEGKNLNQIEESEAIMRLSTLGLTDKEISQKTGKAIGVIGTLKTLHSAPTKIKRHIESGSISATLVLKIVKDSKDSEDAFRIIEQSIENLKVSGKKKVTEKGISQSKGKTNSINLFKKFSKLNAEKVVKDTEIFEFISRLIEGDVSETELKSKFL